MKLALSKEFNHNGTSYKEFDLRLENLTGNDLIEAEESLRRAGIPVSGAADFSRNYLIAVASRALHIPREALMSLPAGDFTRLCNETLIFLAGAASGPESQEQPMK